MLLTNEQLIELTEDAGEFVAEMQEDDDPEDAGFLHTMQCVYTCLAELQAWRAAFPDQSVEMTYYDDQYGTHRLQ